MNRRGVAIAGVVGAAVIVLSVAGSRGGLRVVDHDATITGTGSSGSPLAIAQVVIDNDAGLITSGTGAPGSPLVADLTELDYTSFGDGSDGDCDWDGVNPVLGMSPAAFTQVVGTTLRYSMPSRDIFCDDATIASGVYVSIDGWRVHVRGTLTLNGVIGWQGGLGVTVTGGFGLSLNNTLGGSSAGGTGSPGAAGSCADGCTTPATQSNGYMECSSTTAAGSSGVTGTAAGTGGSCLGGGGGGVRDNVGACNGGVANVGCAGGTMTLASSASQAWMHAPRGFNEMIVARSAGETRAVCGTGGGGGRGGSVTGFGGSSANGGGGGGGGGCVLIQAFQITGSGTVNARGGNGGNGGCTACTTKGAGGGGGGGGGVAHVIIGKGSFPNTDVVGGTGGNGSCGSVNCGFNGGDGGPGKVVLQRAGY